jgi:hypothetical protein
VNTVFQGEISRIFCGLFYGIVSSYDQRGVRSPSSVGRARFTTAGAIDLTHFASEPLGQLTKQNKFGLAMQQEAKTENTKH